LASKIIDARGLSCPEPVILTKQALDVYSGPVEVLVDSCTARENVHRFASSRGFKVEIIEEGETTRLAVSK